MTETVTGFILDIISKHPNGIRRNLITKLVTKQFNTKRENVRDIVFRLVRNGEIILFHEENSDLDMVKLK